MSGALTSTPTTVGNCLTMIVVAMPKAKPRNTGREIRLVRLPARTSAATTKKTPVSSTAAVATIAFASAESCIAAKVAARIAAADEVVETMAKRLRPIRA
ncbi:hypothetical protein GALL_502900 [mine drainage metagenome]|uniref:Uncharacterized protein n=1 Tax=mine drainage metagenome TaxID=410659 RepID=A0A1J5PBL8_9ZZZZ